MTGNVNPASHAVPDVRPGWIAFVVLAFVPFAGCLEDTRDGPTRVAFTARYEGLGMPSTIVLDGPAEIRDRDDLFRSAYRLSFIYDDTPVLTHRVYVDAAGRVVRDDQCAESDSDTCFQPGVGWSNWGMRPDAGALWPWMLEADGQLPLQFELDDRPVQVAGSKSAPEVTVGDRVFRYHDGEPIPYEVRIGTALVRRVQFERGEPLAPIDGWPKQPAPLPKSDAVMFPGETDGRWGWGYTHRDAYDGFRALDQQRSKDLDEGCLLVYWSDAVYVETEEPSLDALAGVPIAVHSFDYLDGAGAEHYEVIEGSRDALGRITFADVNGYGFGNGGVHSCPDPTTTIGPRANAGIFLDRAEALIGPPTPETDLWVWLPDGSQQTREASYRLWDYTLHSTDPLVKLVVMDATTGLWSNIRFTADSPGFIDDPSFDPPSAA